MSLYTVIQCTISYRKILFRMIPLKRFDKSQDKLLSRENEIDYIFNCKQIMILLTRVNMTFLIAASQLRENKYQRFIKNFPLSVHQYLLSLLLIDNQKPFPVPGKNKQPYKFNQIIDPSSFFPKSNVGDNERHFFITKTLVIQ